MINHIPCFEVSVLEAVCRALGDTGDGLTGQEIGYILADMDLEDLAAGMTKWKRIFNALALQQNKHQIGNHMIMFVNRAMVPARFVQRPAQFQKLQDQLNGVLSLAGYGVNDQGKVIRTSLETTVSGAMARVKRLKTMLETRGTHPQVFFYCTAELLAENYFHAVSEAVKGLAERLRQLSGLSIDGAELVNQALSTKTPILALNSLSTETEVSEQKGISNLLVGLFGAIRNPIAHAPKVVWPMPEQDALDVFAIVSFVHRKLDIAKRV